LTRTIGYDTAPDRLSFESGSSLRSGRVAAV
jgi:hypothetical protein